MPNVWRSQKEDGSGTREHYRVNSKQISGALDWPAMGTYRYRAQNAHTIIMHSGCEWPPLRDVCWRDIAQQNP